MFKFLGKSSKSKKVALGYELPEVVIPLPKSLTYKYTCLLCNKEILGPLDPHQYSCKGDGNMSRFVLEFDEPPALVFVQEKTGHGAKVYQDGKELEGIKSIVIKADAGEFTTHTIEYLTGATKGR
jgi:hypothetical protein